MTELKIHVGEGMAEMGQRFVRAWRRAEAGREVDERHLTFASLQDAARILSPRRLELLRAVHRQPAASVRALAAAVGWDYKNVHGDIEALTAAGLVDRDDLGGIRADYDAISVEMAIAL
jgi:predicted transcriptional regulator